MSGVWRSSEVSGIKFFTPTGRGVEMAWVPVTHAVVDGINEGLKRDGDDLLSKDDEAAGKPGYYLCSGASVRKLL